MSAYPRAAATPKLMGVCARFANWSGVDATIVRVALVLLTLFAFGPLAIIAYLLIGWLAA